MNSNKKARTRAEWVMLGLGSVFLCLAVLLIFHAIKSWRLYEEKGSKVEGVVTHAFSGRDGGDASYKFHVGGREYSGSSKHYIPEGKRVIVSYLLSDPSKNRVQDFEWFFIDSTLYIFMSLGMGAVLFALGYSERTANFLSKLGISANFREEIKVADRQ